MDAPPPAQTAFVPMIEVTHAMQIVQACAMSGNCAANNYRDYVLYYTASPSTSQQIAGYEAALRRAAQNNDWSGFVFRPGPSPTIAPYVGSSSP